MAAMIWRSFAGKWGRQTKESRVMTVKYNEQEAKYKKELKELGETATIQRSPCQKREQKKPTEVSQIPVTDNTALIWP